MFIRIYALAVCFATILCMTIAIGIGLFDVVQIATPKLTMSSYEFQNLQSNENFRRSGMVYGHAGGLGLMTINGRAQLSGLARAAQVSDGKETALSEQEVTRLREKQLNLVIDNSRHDAQRSLIQIFIILLVSGPLFYFHWRLAVRLEDQQ